MLKNNKCQNCGGDLEYAPSLKMLQCKSCGSTVDLDDGEQITSHDLLNPTNDNHFVQGVHDVKCDDCGASLTIDNNSLISYCSYCGSQNIAEIEQVSRIAPDAIVPFAFDKTQAKVYHKQWLGKKHFLPRVVKKQTESLKIDANYFSVYVFNGVVDVEYNGVLEYTTVERGRDGRTHKRNHRKHVSGTLTHDFVDQIIECSSNLDQQQLQKITPFNFKDAKAYKGGYLFGSSAELTDKTEQEADNIFKDLLAKQIDRAILRQYHCDRVISLDKNFKFVQKKYTYCLLPSYVINFEHNKKHYTNIMNGQTGKVSGEVPRSGTQIAIFVICLLILIIGSFIIF